MVNLDETDLRILKEFQKDGRMNYAEISRRTRVPSSTVNTGAELRVHYMINVTPYC